MAGLLLNGQSPQISGSHKRRGRFLALLLALALVAQGVLLCKGTVWPLAKRVWDVREDPPLVRSARIAFSDSFADYMAFLRVTVPEAGMLVVPPKVLVPIQGDIGLMQYFLAPRRIVDCPAGPDLAACVHSMDGELTYILGLPEFPPIDAVPASKAFVEHDDGYGVFVPRR